MNDPFRPNAFKFEPCDTKYKLDFCMKKILELEQRIYQLEREKILCLNPISEIRPSVLQSSLGLQNDIKQ